MNLRGILPIKQFSPNGWSNRNITLKLHDLNQTQWSELIEECNDNFYEDLLSKLPYADCDEESVFYTFNDKLYPSSLSPYIEGG